ncbi:hypothetical protein VII00023_00055 [Vibrio ichthyoenteri ATCC 700023]|uniref:Lipoprotein n=1 Tax=Vibrio ichthyoenteri ATCC 700023 TaxID=870968 RepID=F9S1B5_9VIBR|nr:hypothetical protein [Vibrio ichthyoenteri]EGU41954.1 hypothetical protein VII00023_00055 [Vibrio ichthyoenteri ATCC 700023]
MAKKSGLLIFGLFSAAVNACNENNLSVSVSTNSVENAVERSSCSPVVLGGSYPANPLTTPFLLVKEKYDDSDYWSDWVLKTESNPVLTQNFSQSYFGVGWWSPKDAEPQEEDQTAEEWLMNHGLMFSVGFGDKAIGQPRFRLDYLWHDEFQDNLMMQVEVPF